MSIIIGLCVLITLASSTATQQFSKSDKGNRYFVEKQQTYTFFQAWNECARKNMSLLTVDTSEKHWEIDAMLRKIYGQRCLPAYVAATDLAMAGQFEWILTGKTLGFTNWAKDEPNNVKNNEHCIVIGLSYEWVDVSCTMAQGFVCEEHQHCQKDLNEIGSQKDHEQFSESIKYKNIFTFVNGGK